MYTITKLLNADQLELEANAYRHGQKYFGTNAHYKSIIRVYEKTLKVKRLELTSTDMDKLQLEAC